MSATVLQGNVFAVLPTLTPGSIDAVVTSPPYWALRSYLPKGHALKTLEIGSEPTTAAFVQNMVRVFRLVRDAMADHAVCWVNIGDTYSASGAGAAGKELAWMDEGIAGRKAKRVEGVAAGNLCLIPQRLAIALQDDGWIVRSVVVWHKPAPMPASLSGWQWRRCRVKVAKARQTRAKAFAALEIGASSGTGNNDMAATWSDCPGCPKCDPHGGYVLRRGSWRPTSSWEPILMLAKSPRYYGDGIAVEQPAASATLGRNAYSRVIDDPDEQFAVRHDHETLTTTANLRDVWTIAAEPLREKHYAAFPTELVHRCLKASTSALGYCQVCGAPWCRVVDSPPIPDELRNRNGKVSDTPSQNARLAVGGGQKIQDWRDANPAKTTGWRPTCACPPAEPRPGRVLDPFTGSGRTGAEALRLGLDFVGVELNPEYAEMARRLLKAESPLFA